MKFIAIAMLWVSAIGLAGCGDSRNAQGDTRARLLAAQTQSDNWLTHGRDYSETRHSPLTQVTAENVGELGIAWYHDLDTSRGQEATPLIVDGIMYTTSAWSKVQSFDAVTGELLWQYDPEVPGEAAANACCDVVNRGVAYWNGKVVFGTLDGRLIALDGNTGEPVWTTMTVDPDFPYTITGAPRIIDGHVIIGNGGAEMGVRGYVSAYKVETGEKVWRFYTVPGEPGKVDGEVSDAVLAEATETWNGDWWQAEHGYGGGTVWDSMAYDPELDLLYVGVGNGSTWNQSIRSEGEGDNLFVASMLALRPSTGEYVWHFQHTPGDQWDYTSTQHMILADLVIEGAMRPVIMQAPKNGFFFVLDRETGELLSADPYTPVTWATGYDLETGRPQINPAAMYSQDNSVWASMPGAFGGHNWQPMAFNPDTGLVYIPEQQIGFAYKGDENYEANAIGINLGLDLSVADLPDDPAVQAAVRQTVKGNLVAWDPVKREQVWSAPHVSGWNGGVLSTAGNLVFQGDSTGMFSAYDAASGERLWSHDLQTGIIAAPVTWARDGVQYVTVVAGWGGAYPMLMGGLSWNDGAPVANRSRVITFKLGGDRALPNAEPMLARDLVAVTDMADAATIKAGQMLYNRNCIACHGGGAVSGGTVPDLRMSPSLTDARVWHAIVMEGALTGNGMVAFDKNIDREESEAIRHFVADRARIALAAQ